MQRLVLHSVLAAMSALFILSATACDKGGEKKTDNKIEKPEDKAEAGEVAAEAGEPAGTTTTTTTGVVEAAEETDGGGDTEGGGETTGAPVAPDGDSGKAVAEPDPKEPDPKEPDPKTDDKTPTAKIDAKSIFDSKCKSCHGADGKGDTTIGKKVSIPSLASTKISKAEAIKTITDGVPDTKMKGYADKLSKDEIDAVAAYVKKL